MDHQAVEDGAAAPTGQLRERTAWTIADQVVNSCQSLGIGLLIARETGLAGVGAFAIAFAVYQVLMAVTRPLHSDPLAVGFSAATRDRRERAVRLAAGGSLALGLVVGAAVSVAALLTGGSTGAVLLAFGVTVPAFCVQDVWRASFFAAGHPRQAFVNDALVLVALLGGAAVATSARPGSAAALTLAWGVAAAVGALAGSAQARLVPAPQGSRSWWRSTFPLASRMLGENVLANVAYAVALGSVALFSGLSDLGRLRTVQVAVGLMSPVLVAITTVVQAEGTRALSAAQHRFPPLVLGAAAVGAGLALLVTATWLVLPRDTVAAVIGDNWRASRGLVVPWGLYVSLSGVSLGIAAGLRALRRPGAALRARAWGAGLGTAGSLVGAAAGGPVWAVLGFASGELLCAVLTALRFRQAWGAFRQEPWSAGPLPLAGGAPV